MAGVGIVSKPSISRCLVSAGAVALCLSGCGNKSPDRAHTPPPPTSTTTTLPGAGKPPVTIGDKNFTEQFVLGELYYQALKAQGFPVLISQNIGPREVTIRALETGRLGLYPEYIDTWDTAVAGHQGAFSSPAA